jgi:glyceraldehyde 3-phosphate dehydrogenase
MIRIGINGLGRIGKLVFRLAGERDDMEVVAVNDPMLLTTMVHLLRYDSVHGRFGREVGADEVSGELVVDGRRIRKYGHYHPSRIPWGLHRVDLVIEASGLFLTRDGLNGHLQQGAGKVILTCPPKEKLDNMVVIGVNHDSLKPSQHLVSNASCTTNCVAPVLKVLEDAWGIDQVFMNTVHPYTNSQNVMDAPHQDLRRARCANENIIPTTTSAIRAVRDIMPFLEGRFEGFATRVPVSDGSFVEFCANLKSPVTAADLNAAFRRAAEGPLRNILHYCEDPVVSKDIVGNPHSAVFDALSTKVLGDRFVQLLAWYDNEYAYSSRVVELAALLLHEKRGQ